MGNSRTAATATPPVRRARPSLSRELIVDTALRITLEQPTTPLTLARLGAELAADPTALYRHFRSRDELVRELGDHLYSEVARTIRVDGDWLAALRDIAITIRRVMLRRPALAADLGVRFTGGPHERAGVAVIVGILHRAGFSEPDATDHARAFGEFMLAQVVMAASILSMPAAGQDFELRTARSLYGPSMGVSPYEYEDEVGQKIVDTYLVGLAQQLRSQQHHRARANMINHERGEQ